jgi:fumarate hydratase class II
MEKKEYRIERDSLGEVKVPADCFWGAQTQRSFRNFRIGEDMMPLEIIVALTLAKKAAAFANCELGVLSEEKRDWIACCCDDIIEGKLNREFPLCVWQTGSGTQTNMNVNEVISHYAEHLQLQEKGSVSVKLSPNDDVNQSQSTNDMFPTAMRMVAVELSVQKLIPALTQCCNILQRKSEEFSTLVKTGRTHLMDATPLTLGEEFSGYETQLRHGLETLCDSLHHVKELPIGGTAVGNALNAPKGYDMLAVKYINQFTGGQFEFQAAANKFEAMASHDSLVEYSSGLKRIAVSCMKIANDIRLLGSGPRCGLGELILPSNEPGSSIMPGKVNPTQCEALAMVCCQVIGNDLAITTGAMQGHLELNVFMPLIAKNSIHSIHILSDALLSFCEHCLEGIQPNIKQINKHLQQSLMLVTALNPYIGYDDSAKIARYAHEHDLSLREAVMELKLISIDRFDEIMKKSIYLHH